jgi:hypothetical protein
VRRTLRQCVARLESRADCFLFGDPFFDRFGFGLQVLQVRFQLRDSLCACGKSSLEMNLRTFAALVAIAFTLPATLVLATATFVATTLALTFFVMLSVPAPVTATIAVMLFTVSAHVSHLFSCLNWAWLSNYSLHARKRKPSMRQIVWLANLMRSYE